jgi:methyl-accepting chemotaxis protein
VAFFEILEGAKTNADAAKQISMSTRQQERASQQVVFALKEISEGANQNAGAIHQTQTIVEDLAEISKNLKELVSQFQYKAARKNNPEEKGEENKLPDSKSSQPEASPLVTEESPSNAGSL